MELANRYRNVSGTILIINDIGVQIPINGIIENSSSTDGSLNFREHIAMNNLVPDFSDNQAIKIMGKEYENTLNIEQVRDIMTEVTGKIKEEILDLLKSNMKNTEESVNIEEITIGIKNELLEFLKSNTEVNVSELEVANNKYEAEIETERAKKINDAVNKKFKGVNIINNNEDSYTVEDSDSTNELKETLNGGDDEEWT